MNAPYTSCGNCFYCNNGQCSYTGNCSGVTEIKNIGGSWYCGPKETEQYPPFPECVEYKLILKKQKVDLQDNKEKNLCNPLVASVILTNNALVYINKKEFVEHMIDTLCSKLKEEFLKQEFNK